MNNSKNKFIRELVQRIEEAYRRLAERYINEKITNGELLEDIETEGYYFVKDLKDLKEKRRK